MGDAKAGKKSKLLKRRQRQINLWCWLFLAPAVFLYVMFQGYPIFMGFFYSLLDWSGLSSNAVLVGLDNYKELLKDPLFFNAIKNTFLYILMTVPLLLTFSLGLAYLFNSILKKCVTLYRTVFFLPVITTTSIVGIIMMFIFGGTGAVNQLLALFGVNGVNWLGNKDTALLVVALVGCWKDVGTYMICLLYTSPSPRDS